MSQLADRAFLLSSTPWRETSVWMDVLTEHHGRQRLLAKSVRVAKPRWPRAWFAPFVPISIEWRSKGDLGWLSLIDNDSPPFDLRGAKTACGLYVNELLCALLQAHAAVPELWSRYAQLLQELGMVDATHTAQLAWLLRRFERDLLAELGFGLTLDTEIESGREVDAEQSYWLDAWRGALPCDASREGSVPGRALLALAHDAMPTAPGDLLALRNAMRRILGTHLQGKILNAWRVLREPREYPS
jgi:DNA repair protein RecO (recombination protein O)